MKPWPNLFHYFGIFMEALKNTTAHLKSKPCPGSDLKQGPSSTEEDCWSFDSEGELQLKDRAKNIEFRHAIIYRHKLLPIITLFLWRFDRIPGQVPSGLAITLTGHSTLGRNPLDEWPARRRDLYLTTHNTHNRQTSIPPSGIRTHNPSKRAAADPRLRLRGHWDRRHDYIYNQILQS